MRLQHLVPTVAVVLACCLGLTAVPAEAAPQEGPGGTLVVLNKSAATASLIEVESGRTLATLPTGRGPHELVVSTDGRTAVGTDYSGGNSLTVIDIPGRRVVRTVDLSSYARPHGLQFLPGDSLVAVTSEATGNVVLVRVATGEVTKAIPTGAGGSHMLAVVGDGSRIYTGNMSDASVSELDVATGTRTRSFRVPPIPEAITVSRDGSEVWVGSNGDGTVSVLSTVDGSVDTPLAGFQWPYRILLVPERGLVVLPDFRGNQLRIVEHASKRELARLDFPGGGPQGVVLTPDGRWLFLSLNAQDRVALIDLESLEVVRYLTTGSGPDGIGWSPR